MPPQNRDKIFKSQLRTQYGISGTGSSKQARWRAFYETSRQDSRYLHPQKYVPGRGKDKEGLVFNR